MANKMTNSVALQMAIDTLSADAQFAEVVEKLTAIKASVDRKSTHKTPKELDRISANESIKASILELTESGQSYSVNDIQALLMPNELTVSKVSAMMVQLTAEDYFSKAVVKRKNVYTRM